MGGKKKILIIDDEEVFGRLLKLNVEESQEYEAVLAVNGAQGVAMAQQEKPDLILLDIRMPDMDGLTVLRKIKVLTPEVPVAMVTAVWSEREAKEAFAAGAYEYITKPVNFEYLRTALLVKLYG